MKSIFATICLCASPTLAGDLPPCEPTETSTTQLGFNSAPRILTNGNSTGLIQLENNDILVYNISQDNLDLASTISRPRIKQFVIHHNFAIIIYPDDSTIEIIDLQNPTAPNTVLNLSLPANVAHLELQSNLLAVSMADSGMTFYDMSDPSKPLFLATHKDIQASISSLSNTKMLAFGSVYDISDITNPTIIASGSPSGFLFDTQILQPISNGMLFFDLNGNKTGVDFNEYASYGAPSRNNESLWRVSSFMSDQSPILASIGIGTYDLGRFSSSTFSRLFGSVDSIKGGRADQRAIYTSNNGVWLYNRSEGFTDKYWFRTVDSQIAGNTLYMLNAGGVNRYDLSDASALIPTGSFNLQQPTDEPNSLSNLYLGDNVGVISIEINDGFLFPNGIRVFDLNTLQEIIIPEIVSGTNTALATSVAVHGRRIAVERNFGPGFFEIDENNQSIPLGSTSMISFIRSVDMYDDILASNGSGDGTTLNIFDLSDPSSIQLAGEITNAMSPQDSFVLIDRNTIAITDGALIKILDISDPTSPVQIQLIDSSDDEISNLSCNEGILSAIRDTSEPNFGDMEAYYYDIADLNNVRLVEKLNIDFGNHTGHSASRRVVSSTTIHVYEACFMHCQADINGDGSLDFFDVQAFIDALLKRDPISDLTGDGRFNFFDISEFLSLFAAGCP
jgi:hypothetical protein